MTVTHRCELALPQDPRISTVGALFESRPAFLEDTSADETKEDRAHEAQLELLAQLKRIELIATGLSTPLWAVVVLLFALFMQQVFFG